jgi:hypothetical protein
VMLTRSCDIGYRYVLSSYAELYSALILNINSMNAFASAMPPAQCVKCTNGTISNRFDAQTCRYFLSHVQLSALYSLDFTALLTLISILTRVQPMLAWNYSKSTVHTLHAMRWQLLQVQQQGRPLQTLSVSLLCFIEPGHLLYV